MGQITDLIRNVKMHTSNRSEWELVGKDFKLSWMKQARWKGNQGLNQNLKEMGGKVLVGRARWTCLRGWIVLTILFLILKIDLAKGYWGELEKIYVSIQIFTSTNTFTVKCL